MKKLCILLCLLPVLSLILPAQAQPATAPDASATSTDASAPVDPAKVIEIRKLLELTGTVKITKQVMDQMITGFRSQNNSVSSEFWDRFEKEMDIDGLVNKMIPIYAKYYTLDDLKTVNTFYQTPTGQRVLAATPQIMQESMGIGREWGQQVVSKLLAELKEEKEKARAEKAADSTAPATTPPPPTDK
jgi:hypothetical protein